METTLKKEEKIGGKNSEKYIHKLNKQQREWWRHLANWFKLFCIPKNSCEIFLMETMLKEVRNSEEENAQKCVH